MEEVTYQVRQSKRKRKRVRERKRKRERGRKDGETLSKEWDAD